MKKSPQNFFQKYDAIISLILGTVLVIVIGVLTFSIISSARQSFKQITQDSEQTNTLPTTYMVMENDTLWSIAMKFYNTGDNWTAIANANKLENADDITAGQELTIPDIKQTTKESGDILDGATTDVKKPLHTEVTVVAGDCLWSIAQREYGDGYRWVDIAGANAIITNPDLIYPNMVLRLP